MRISKSEVVALLRLAGRHDEVGRCQRLLPEKVDSGQHGSLLDELGIRAVRADPPPGADSEAPAIRPGDLAHDDVTH